MESNPNFLTVNLSTNIGFEVAGGIFDMHLTRNQELPCTFSKTYITAFDYQSELLFPMYCGERKLIRYCEPLAHIKCKNITKSKAGELKIEMTLTVDKDENLKVTAVETYHMTKKQLAIEFFYLDNCEQKGYKLILDGANFKEQDNLVESKIREFKLTIKSVREKSKEYKVREEMNTFLNSLNKSREILSIEVVNQLLADLYAKIIELKININLSNINIVNDNVATTSAAAAAAAATANTSNE